MYSQENTIKNYRNIRINFHLVMKATRYPLEIWLLEMRNLVDNIISAVY